MNEEMTRHQRCQREETERKLRFIKENKVKITDSVTIGTDSVLKLPRLLKPAGVSPQRRENHWLSPPSLEDAVSLQCLNKARNIIKDGTHPGHELFACLPSERRYRSLKSKTNIQK